MGAYAEAYRRSLAEPDAFWLAAARTISWTKPPERALDDAHPPFYRWFPGAELNTSYNALDRHVEAGRGGQAALIWDSPVTGQQRTYTYEELRDTVARFAGALSSLGVTKGDRAVVAQRDPLAVSRGDMAVERVLARVDHPVDEPTVKGSGRRVEDRLRRRPPVDALGSVGPKTLRVRDAALESVPVRRHEHIIALGQPLPPGHVYKIPQP